MSRRPIYTILVTGSRKWTDVSVIEQHLDRAALMAPKDAIIRLVHGAAKGADMIADRHARYKGWRVKRYIPDWKKHGKRAGIIRNEEMLRESKPNAVVAFHKANSPGTADMIKRVRGEPDIHLFQIVVD